MLKKPSLIEEYIGKSWKHKVLIVKSFMSLE